MVFLVPQGGGHATAPEACAILTDMPAIIRRPAVSPRSAQFFLGRFLLVRWEETRERLAADLGFLVSEQTFSPDIPTDDPPLGIHHEDAVVLHVLDEEMEPLVHLMLLLRHRRNPLQWSMLPR